jgi:hypothetical protein
MSISEAPRFDMQVGLRSHLGDDVANIEKEVSRMNGTMKVLIGGVLTVSVALVVLLIQLNMNISQL